MLALPAALIYCLLALSQWRPNPLIANKWLICSALALAVVLHTLGLKQAIWVSSGLDLGLFNAVSVVALVIAVILLLSQLRDFQVNLGQWLLPICAVAVLVGIFIESPYEARSFSFGVTLHILFALLALAVFSVTMVYALLLRTHDRALKNHHLSTLTKRLPPLQSMERTQFKLAWIGFTLLTLAMLMGFIFVDNYFAQHLLHKTSLTLLSWLFFAVLFIGHHVWGWRALMTLRWYTAAYVLLLLAFFGSKFVLEVILQRSA